MDSQFHSEEGQFEWVKPDLSPGSPWHLARIYNLVDSCKGLRDRNQQFLKGFTDLVCRPAVRRKYYPGVLTGTSSTPS
jgi:hypothetical protein